MGCTASTPEQKENKRINEQMKLEAQKDEQKIKLLLLGAGESGKSTLFKQMRLLYTKEKTFTDNERITYKANVYKNIVEDMKRMIYSCESHTKLVDPVALDAAGKIMKYPKTVVLTPEHAADLLAVWNDPGMQQTWENRGDIQVQDSLEYFMMNVQRISSVEYSPTNMDILRTRVRTSGIVQENFMIDTAELEMYDVGGQRNERRKWVGAFDGVTSVIFVAAISEYNQVLYEDAAVSRQDEAVDLFRKQLQLPVWQNTPFILFLNKTDLFKEKLPKIPFRVDSGNERRNVDFTGPHCDLAKEYAIDGSDQDFEDCYNAACNYLQNLYEKQSPPSRSAQIYTKLTNSTDSENIKHIMTSCKDIIMRGNLAKIGFMG